MTAVSLSTIPVRVYGALDEVLMMPNEIWTTICPFRHVTMDALAGLLMMMMDSMVILGTDDFVFKHHQDEAVDLCVALL